MSEIKDDKKSMFPIVEGTIVNILGSDWVIHVTDLVKSPIYSRFKVDGLTLSDTKEIVITDCSYADSWTSDREKVTFFKKVARHEIIHAFLAESGLEECTLQYNKAWSQNEEMIDWFAIQLPKIFNVYKELGILEVD